MVDWREYGARWCMDDVGATRELDLNLLVRRRMQLHLNESITETAPRETGS